MASGLYSLQRNITNNLSRCIKHSISSRNPHKSRWRSVTSISFNPGFVDDTYQEVKKQENVPRKLDLYTLKKKEKGDWRNLTLQEKRALYHVSFNQPFCDIEQPADEWKLILAGAFTAMGLMTLGLFMWFSQYERTESVVGPISLQIDPKEKELLYNKKFSNSS